MGCARAGVDGGSAGLAAGPAVAPVHVAIIMDGNGRWAPPAGCRASPGTAPGRGAVRRAIEGSVEAGVSWLTLYAFSSENWRRPIEEVLDLTGLLRHFIRQELQELTREGVRVRVLGERSRFDRETQAELDRAEAVTRGNVRLNLNIALSYGARDEIVAAARGRGGGRRGRHPRPGHPGRDRVRAPAVHRRDARPRPGDPHLRRAPLSNFLLWQSAYAELVFQDVLWPDFSAADLQAALAEYARRERRFGARPG